MQIEPSVIEKVNRVFEVLDGIKRERKGMVNGKFIIKKLFSLMDMEVDIDTIKSKRTLKRYEQFWRKTMQEKEMSSYRFSDDFTFIFFSKFVCCRTHARQNVIQHLQISQMIFFA